MTCLHVRTMDHRHADGASSTSAGSGPRLPYAGSIDAKVDALECCDSYWSDDKDGHVEFAQPHTFVVGFGMGDGISINKLDEGVRVKAGRVEHRPQSPPAHGRE